ncbi:unnamed protein product [Closterium sp. NIES-64]|nr:unnamed protein product [Closterium sp. NIES-64]
MGNSESRPADKRSRERASVVSGRSSNGSVAQLIARERSATVGSMMSSRRNPMIAAAAAGNVELVARLLASGVDRNGCCSTGKTPLMAAARGGHVAVVTLLLINDASVLRFDKTSARSCLHMAARAGSAECVEAVLVAAKASHELRDSCPGNHALHMAARSGSVGTVLALLAWGADRTALNHSKLTPHALAVRAERERGWKARAETGKNALAEKGVRAERRGSGRAGGGKSGAGGASASAGGVPPRSDFKRVVALLNPKSPAPLVWPTPWAQLLARAPPHVVWLLRAALAQAGGEEAEEAGEVGQREEKGETEGMKGSGVKRRGEGVCEQLRDIHGDGGSGSRGGRCGVVGDGGGDVVREGWVEGGSGSRGTGMGAGTGGEVSEERGAHEAREHVVEQGGAVGMAEVGHGGGIAAAKIRDGEGNAGRERDCCCSGDGRKREEERKGGEAGACGRVDRELGDGVGVESAVGRMFELGQTRMEERQGGQGGEAGEGGVSGGLKQEECVGGGGLDGEVEGGSAGEGGEGTETGSRQSRAERAQQQEGMVGQQTEHTAGEQGGRSVSESARMSTQVQEGVAAQETEQAGEGVMAREQVGRVEEGRRDGERAVGDGGSRRGSGGEADGSVCLICCEPRQSSSTTTSPFSSGPLSMSSTGSSSSSNLTTHTHSYTHSHTHSHTHSYTLSPPLSPSGGFPPPSPGYLLALLPCSHRLCPTCVLSLLAHTKPNLHVALPPSPVCPFCRCGIEGLDVAR